MLHAAGGVLEVHIDSPTGTLLGKTTTIVPTKGPPMGTAPQIVMTGIMPTAGKHAIYFVFKNDTSPAGQPLFILTNIQYINGTKK
jgi:cytochrome c